MDSMARKGIPKTGTQLGLAAVSVAVKLLQNDAVREQLRKAPDAVTSWAAERRAKGERSVQKALAAANPAEYVGQRKLTKRLDNLERGTALAFGPRADAQHDEVYAAIDDLRRALAVAAGLPTTKRTRLHLRIGSQVDTLERGLIDAVLPRL